MRYSRGLFLCSDKSIDSDSSLGWGAADSEKFLSSQQHEDIKGELSPPEQETRLRSLHTFAQDPDQHLHAARLIAP